MLLHVLGVLLLGYLCEGNNGTLETESSTTLDNVVHEAAILNNANASLHFSNSCPALTFPAYLQSIIKPQTPTNALKRLIRLQDSVSRAKKTRKITCRLRPDQNATEGRVIVMNSTKLMENLREEGRCVVLLFYARWCPFSAAMAADYNALGRVFPQLDVVAIDAISFNSLNLRFGTYAVPTVLVFHNAKPVTRFNNSTRSLENMAAFVSNVTGLTYNATISVSDDDRIGPLLSNPEQQTDVYLVLAWLFVLFSFGVMALRSERTTRLLFRYL